MSDIVERLRLLVPSDSSGAAFEAVNKIAGLRAEVERLRAALRSAYEVYAGSDGFTPETAAEGYQQQIIRQMVSIISAALGDTHMSDIVERLRSGAAHQTLVTTGLVNQAADEITRLRNELHTAVWSDSEECKLLTAKVEKLRAALEQIAGYRMKGKSDAEIARAALENTHE